MSRITLVTGANRGLGREVCRKLSLAGHQVFLSARNVEAGQKAAAEITEESGSLVRFVPLDLADPDSIHAARDTLVRTGHRVEILVNNGAILERGKFLDVSDEALSRSIRINLEGAVSAMRAFAPGMIAAGWGRIVNVSSGWGSFAEGLGGPLAYSLTKAALNAATVIAAQDLPSSIKVNAVCPDWVRTAMGGPDATLSLEEGAAGIVWAATLPDDGPSGGFFRHGKPVSW